MNLKKIILLVGLVVSMPTICVMAWNWMSMDFEELTPINAPIDMQEDSSLVAEDFYNQISYQLENMSVSRIKEAILSLQNLQKQNKSNKKLVGIIDFLVVKLEQKAKDKESLWNVSMMNLLKETMGYDISTYSYDYSYEKTPEQVYSNIINWVNQYMNSNWNKEPLIAVLKKLETTAKQSSTKKIIKSVLNYIGDNFSTYKNEELQERKELESEIFKKSSEWTVKIKNIDWNSFTTKDGTTFTINNVKSINPWKEDTVYMNNSSATMILPQSEYKFLLADISYKKDPTQIPNYSTPTISFQDSNWFVWICQNRWWYHSESDIYMAGLEQVRFQCITTIESSVSQGKLYIMPSQQYVPYDMYYADNVEVFIKNINLQK